MKQGAEFTLKVHSEEKKIWLKKVLLGGLLVIDVVVIILSIGSVARGTQRYLQLRQEVKKERELETRLHSEMIEGREKQNRAKLQSAQTQIIVFALLALFMLILGILLWLALSGQLPPLLSTAVITINGFIVGALVLLVVLTLVFLELALRGLISL